MSDGTVRRNTQQRRVVLEELKRVTSHPTAADLHEMARRRLPKISLGTVYRNLELLARMGLVRRLEMGGAETRYDADTTEHAHVRCVDCGRVDDAFNVLTDILTVETRNLSGYEVLGYHLEFVGVCPDCQSGGRKGRSAKA